MGGMNSFGTTGGMHDLKRKREESEDIPRPFLRGGDAVWTGAGTGANTIAVKVKSESPSA